MSQAIIKAEGGVKIPDDNSEKLFDAAGRSIKLNDMLETAFKIDPTINKSYAQQYMESQHWSKKNQQAYIDAFKVFTDGLKSGRISRMDASRSFFDKFGTGDMTNTEKGFDPYGEVVKFYSTVADKTNSYVSPTPVPEQKKYAKILTPEEILFDGYDESKKDDFYQSFLDQDQPGENGLRLQTNRLSYLKSRLDSALKYYDDENNAFEDQDKVNSIKGFLMNALSTLGKSQNGSFVFDSLEPSERLSWNQLGFTNDILNNYIFNRGKEIVPPPLPPLTEDQEWNNYFKGLAKEAQWNPDSPPDYMEYFNNDYSNDNQMNKWNEDYGSWEENDRNKEIFNNIDKGLRSFDPQMFYKYIPWYYNHSGSLKTNFKAEIPEMKNAVFFPQTINTQNWTVTVYDPDSSNVYEMWISTVPGVQKYLRMVWKQKRDAKALKEEQGGILKAQYGTLYPTYSDTSNSSQKKAEEKKDFRDVSASAKKKHEREIARKEDTLIDLGGENGKLSYAEVGELVKVLTDLADIVNPDPTSSTITNVVGSAADAYGYGHTYNELFGSTGRFLKNLGTDIAYSIPLLEQKKIARVFKNLLKYLPKIQPYLAALNVGKTGIDLTQMIIDGANGGWDKSWKEYAIPLLYDTLRSIVSIKDVKQSRKLLKELSENGIRTTQRTLKTTEGETPITALQEQTLKGKKKVDDANTYLATEFPNQNVKVESNIIGKPKVKTYDKTVYKWTDSQGNQKIDIENLDDNFNFWNKKAQKEVEQLYEKTSNQKPPKSKSSKTYLTPMKKKSFFNLTDERFNELYPDVRYEQYGEYEIYHLPTNKAAREKFINDFNLSQHLKAANKFENNKNEFLIPNTKVVIVKHEDGGKLEYIKYLNTLREGGIIKASTGTQFEETWRVAKPKSYLTGTGIPYNRDTYTTYYNNNEVDQDLLNIIKGFSIQDAQQYLNNVHSAHSNINNWDTAKYNQHGFQNFNTAFNAGQTEGVHGGNNIFGYSYNVSDLFGPSTFNRHLAYQRLSNAHQSNSPIQYTDNTGQKFDLYFDPTATTNPWKVKSVQSTGVQGNTPQAQIGNGNGNNNGAGNGVGAKSGDTTVLSGNGNGNGSSETDIDPNLVVTGNGISWDKIYKAYQTYKPDAIRTVRLAQILGTNAAAAAKLKEGIIPYSPQTWEESPYETGAYSEKMAYHNAGSNLEQVAALNSGVNQETNTLAALTAANLGNEKRIQGNLIDDQERKESKQRSYDATNRNKDRFTNRANLAQQSKLSALEAKATIDSGLITSSANSINTWLKDFEIEAREDLRRRRELDYQNRLAQLQYEYEMNPEYKNWQNKYNAWKTEHPNLSFQQWPEYNNYLDFQRRLLYQRQKDQSRIYSDVYNINLMKRGGKHKNYEHELNYKSNKSVRDAHVKLLDNLSGLTKTLILKALGI